MAPKMPKDVETRLKRGREAMEKGAPMRSLCLEFARGNQYLWLGQDGRVYDAQRGQVRSDPNYPNRHRVRQTRNLILPIVNAKVSAATQRIPGYEVLPSTLDPEDVAGAQIGQKAALAGYEKWRLRRAAQKAVYLALVADESYAFPYWDPNIGPYVEGVGMGEVKCRILSRSQVLYEPGVEFEDTPWLAITYGRPADEIAKEPGFIGEKLVPDAEARGLDRKTKKNLVLVTEYFERPCPDYAEGRRLVLANEKLIFPEESYPLRDSQGSVIDEVCLHRLSYMIDPDADSDFGLVRHLLDAQRTFNDATNKQLEAKNLALITQLLAPEGSILNSPTDAPGEVVYYRIMPGMPAPEWREPPNPQLLAQLSEIADRAQADMGVISDQNQLPSSVTAARAIQSLIEKDQLAWQRFIGDLAEWHSRVMRDSLTLVQRFYTEPRLMKFRGRLGWQPLNDFRGADLHNQTDVRVLPGSLEAQTKDAIQTKVMNFAQLGWISPEAAMAAIDGGTAEGLVDSYEKDVARANLILQKIDAGPQVLYAEPPRPVFPNEDAGYQLGPDGQPLLDEMGQPVMNTEVPGWMPRPFDDPKVERAVIEDFLKGPAYDAWTPDQKNAVNQYYAALLDLEAKNAAREQALQVEMAQNLGMSNAAKPTVKPMPSLAAPNGTSGQ